MEEIVKLVHNNYEKITDDLMWLSKNWMLRFCVVLNKKSDKFGRQNYHKEVGYYKQDNYCVNINRSFDYYLSFDCTVKDLNGMKDSISIRVTDMYVLKFKLNLVAEWFTAEHNQGLFAKKDGRIFMPTSTNPIRICGLMFDKYIEFEPSILDLDNGSQLVGVRIYMNSATNSLFMDISKFLGFKDFIDTFNMYQSAQLMLNYLQRPAPGSNMFDIGNKPHGHKFLV